MLRIVVGRDSHRACSTSLHCSRDLQRPTPPVRLTGPEHDSAIRRRDRAQ